MSLDAGISNLIGRIYDGGHDAAIWNQALDGLLQRTGSRFLLVSIVDLKKFEFSNTRFHGADDARFLDAVRDYNDGFYADDPTLQFGKDNPRAGGVKLSAIIPTDYEIHPYVRWLRATMGSGDCMVRYTVPVDDLTFALSIHPFASQGAHNAADLSMFGMFFQHAEHAMRLAARAPDLMGESEAALVIDRRGKVVVMSRRAEQLLAQADGLSMTDRQLRGATSRETARIDRAIIAALGALEEGSAGGAVAVQRPSGRRPFALTITPLAASHGPFAAFRPSALVRIIDPEEGPPPGAAARWAALYSLTPAETRLAETLLRGEGNLRRAADHLGIAYATARVQLASLFAKTGVGSQSQLARLLSRVSIWAMAAWTAVAPLLPASALA